MVHTERLIWCTQRGWYGAYREVGMVQDFRFVSVRHLPLCACMGKIAKEQAIEALRYWKCHVCFHVNQPERDHCAMCNEQRVVFTEDQKLQKELESDFTFFNMSSLTRGESNI